MPCLNIIQYLLGSLGYSDQSALRQSLRILGAFHTLLFQCLYLEHRIKDTICQHIRQCFHLGCPVNCLYLMQFFCCFLKCLFLRQKLRKLLLIFCLLQAKLHQPFLLRFFLFPAICDKRFLLCLLFLQRCQ